MDVDSTFPGGITANKYTRVRIGGLKVDRGEKLPQLLVPASRGLLQSVQGFVKLENDVRVG